MNLLSVIFLYQALYKERSKFEIRTPEISNKKEIKMNHQRSISLSVSIAAVAGLEIATSSETTAFGMINSDVIDCLDVVDLSYP